MNDDTPNGRMPWTDERLAIFRLALSSGIGPCRYQQLRKQFGSPQDCLAGLAGMRRKDVRIASVADAEATIAAANNAGAEIMLRSDGIYPERLAQTARAPLALYYKGEASRLGDPWLVLSAPAMHPLPLAALLRRSPRIYRQQALASFLASRAASTQPPIVAHCKDFRLALSPAVSMWCR